MHYKPDEAFKEPSHEKPSVYQVKGKERCTIAGNWSSLIRNERNSLKKVRFRAVMDMNLTFVVLDDEPI